MIKKIYEDGKPKDTETKTLVDNFLNDLKSNDLEFVIGVDYARKESEDFTAISQFVENEDGSLTHMGTKLI